MRVTAEVITASDQVLYAEGEVIDNGEFHDVHSLEVRTWSGVDITNWLTDRDEQVCREALIENAVRRRVA